MMNKKKFLALFMAVLMTLALLPTVAFAAEVKDTLKAANFTATSTVYQDFSGVTTDNSDAVYAGNSAKDSNGNIQLRSKNSNSGIVSTTSGGTVKSVKITVGSGSNTIDVYGSNTAYSAATDLYGSNQGTKVGSLMATGTVTFTDDYQYVGIRSNSGAIYLSSVEITWNNGGTDPQPTYTITAQSNNTDYGTVSLSDNVITASPKTGYRVSATDPYTVTSGTATVEQDQQDLNKFTVTANENCTVQINFELIPKAQVNLTFTPGEGGGSNYETTKTEDDVFVLPLATDNALGFTAPNGKPHFDYWKVGNDKHYAGEKYVVTDEDVTFEAQWTTNTLDVLDNASTINKNTSSYSSWTATGESSAVYDGQSAGSYSSIQLRTNNYNSGIVTISSDGYIKEVRVVWNNQTVQNRVLNVYVSQNEYESPADLYSGDPVGTITRTKAKETEEVGVLTISGDVNYQYVGVRSADGALYLDSITFVWEPDTGVTKYAVSFDPGDGEGVAYSLIIAAGEYTLPQCTFTAPTDYRFSGWKIQGDQTETVYAAGDKITISGPVTLVAQWKYIYTNMMLKRVPTNGDTVVVYYPGTASDGSKVMTEVESYYNNTKYRFKSAAASLTGNTLKVPDEAIRLTVSVDNNKYTFSTTVNGETKYLYVDGTDAKLVDETGPNTLFQLERIQGSDNYLIKCDSAVYTDSNQNEFAQYLEYYNGAFKPFSMQTDATSFTFQFFAENGEGPTQFVTHTVTYVADNNTEETLAPFTVNDGASHTLITLEESGFTAPANKHFKGWRVNNEDTVRNPGIVIENITADVTVTAVWEENAAVAMKAYTLVTSLDQLQENDKIIIVGLNGNSAYALSDQKSTHNRSAYGITLDSNWIALPASDVNASGKAYELTLYGDATQGWSFYDSVNGGYLYPTGEKNKMDVQLNLTVAGQFNLTIDPATGAATAESAGEATYKYFRFNSSNSLFSCYNAASTVQDPIYIFKEITDGYYLVRASDWSNGNITLNDLCSFDKFEQNQYNEAEYMLNTTLKVGDQFKVARLENGAVTAVYPNTWNHNDGQGEVLTKPYGYYDDQKINAYGNYTIYFRPDYPENDWYYRCIYVHCESVAPSFVGQKLVLGDEIVVRFSVNLPTADYLNYEGSKMTISVDGRGAKSKTTDITGTGTLSFDFGVNALQMADTITATLNYKENGSDKTIEKTYSVKEYIDTFEKVKDQFDETTVALVHALADYGHYVQLFIGEENNNVTIGTDYASMSTFYAQSYDKQTVSNAVSQYAIVRPTTTLDDFQIPTFSLVLDSKTAIRVYFRPFASYTAGVKFKVDDGEQYQGELVNGAYMVEIGGLSAHKLKESHTIVATGTDESITVRVCALSYVGSLLTSSTYGNKPNAINAVCSLYYYSEAADAYKAAH